MSYEEIPSQSNLSFDTMQHIPDHQPQADFRTTAFDEVTSGRRGFAASVTQQSIPHESLSLTQAVRSGLGLYRFWAVLIGINAYARDPLRGCVSDALLIKRFLTNDLGVPENRIQCLLGPKYPNSDDPKSTPSRTNIIDTLYSLVNNPKIERGDNIIIYYAGHGTSYYCEKHDLESRCDTSCPIEALCPIDRDYQDSDGNWIPDISDRELNSLFTLICRAKGQNITFIADCCYSGGMSRGLHATAVGRQSRIHRTALTYNASLEDMLHAADEQGKDFPGYRSVLSKDWEADMDSHVILAACQSDQVVIEVKGTKGFGGAFSKELVRVLRSADCKEETTYDDLIRLLNQLPYQTPLVAGTRMFKPIFYRASSRFWAVLIGIDAYARDPLRGCVSDALLIKRFLTNDLGIPEKRIQCLLGSKYPNSDDPKSMPSRANIVDTLYSLANNPEIEQGDSIIVYFSGAGCYYRCSEHPHTVKCPSGFCPTEVLWPIDRNTQDADGSWIPDISDRELNNLFALICRAKGHKITFIVDSGYSGAMNRGQQPRIRSTTFKLTSNASLESILHAADERWKHFLGYQSVLSKDWRPDTDSHVILAACRSLEMHGRNGYSRIFTEILLGVLRSTDWKKEMTYDDLVNLMTQSLSARFSLVPFPLVSGKRMKEHLWY